MMTRRYIFLLFLAPLLFSCKQKKKPSLSGEETVAIGDFIEFFQPLALPFGYGDSSLLKKENDSLLIGYKVFAQFVPDSVLHPFYSKKERPRIYPIGKVTPEKAETYLYVKTVSGDKRSAWLLVFDRKKQFTAAMNVLRPDQNASTSQSFYMDRRGTITKTLQRKNADGSMSEGKDVFAYSQEARTFSLIMTDALEDKPTELINPIDTLPRKFKYAGDYSSGKMNLVSIRDGRRSDRVTFFIHFDKGQDCTGELKGEAMLRGPNTAEYNRDGDPCKLKFIFSGTRVSLKEEGGCGSYRPLNCSFDLQFPKKKEPRPKKGKKK